MLMEKVRFKSLMILTRLKGYFHLFADFSHGPGFGCRGNGPVASPVSREESRSVQSWCGETPARCEAFHPTELRAEI